MTATPEPGATPDLLANLRRSLDVLAAPLDSIDLPADHPNPWPVPGSVAIATVRGVEGQVVVWSAVPPAEEGAWYLPALGTLVPDGAVDVTHRAAIVTGVDLEELLDGFPRQTHILGIAAREDIREWFAARLGGGR